MMRSIVFVLVCYKLGSAANGAADSTSHNWALSAPVIDVTLSEARVLVLSAGSRLRETTHPHSVLKVQPQRRSRITGKSTLVELK